MDISLRIQTPNSSGLSDQVNPANTCACAPFSNSQISSSTQGTMPSTQSSSYVGTQDPLKGIVINNTINGLPAALQSSATSNVAAPTTSAVSAKDDWAKTMLSEMKTMFDGFLSSMTKLLESFLGKKTDVPSLGSGAQTQAASSASTQNTNTAPTSQSAVGETFAQRTVRNMGTQLQSKVSEESMREYVLMYQLYQKDQESESLFKTSLSKHKALGANSDQAIKKSLMDLESAGKLQRWESDWIYSLSANAAQLDGGKDVSKNQSVSGDAAIRIAETNLSKIASGVDVPAKLQIA